MKGYGPESYGERIADVYDDWFGGVSDVDTTVAFLDELVSARPARFLELAVGTGRLALPLAALGHDVTGIDVSAAMLDRLRANDPQRRVTTIQGDMVDDLPAGPSTWSSSPSTRCSCSSTLTDRRRASEP